MGTECTHHRHGDTVHRTWKGKRFSLVVICSDVMMCSYLKLKVVTCVY